MIADAIRGKRYCEWGVGGTTVWLAEEASVIEACSVEHDKMYISTTSTLLPVTWTAVWSSCTPGPNATIGEEQADDAEAYIAAGVDTYADIYLIDGVVRSRCLSALVATGRPMTIFIHDTQRDWYDDAIAEAMDAGFARTDYPEGEDYPGCLLTKLEKTR